MKGKSVGRGKVPFLYSGNVPFDITSSRNLITLPNLVNATNSFMNTLKPTSLATDSQSSELTPIRKAKGQNKYCKMLFERHRGSTKQMFFLYKR
jgi:hypothetical protein